MTGMEIEFDVAAKLRDGTVLRADVYRPTSGGPWPVLLHRTPYGRRWPVHAMMLDPFEAVSRGYMLVQQDTRGRFGSDGEWLPLTFEGDDGYDTVQWAASLPGSNGEVGMFGGSYMGHTSWAAAVAAPPELRAIVPLTTWCDPRDGLFFRGGAIELGTYAAWSLTYSGMADIAKRAVEDPVGAFAALSSLIADIDDLPSRVYWELPSGALPTIAQAGITDIGVQRALADPSTADGATVTGKHDHVEAASFNVGGWYDMFQQGTLDNHVAMTRLGKPTRLLVGPWSHASLIGLFGGMVGEVNFGMASSSAMIEGTTPLTQLELSWFDHWLKGIDSGVTAGPPVKIFVMGTNVWRDENEWPLSRAADTAWHLRADGGLTPEPPSADESSDSYLYDPADPAVTHGGAFLISPVFTPGPVDQRVVEDRADVLVYTSDPLTDDLEVTGRIRMRLHATTDAPSTDWVVRLCDVDTSNVSRNLCDGILRVHATPGEPAEHEIDLWSTSNVFLAGHRIRVQVTSSNFPRWDRNLNTGESPQTATTMRVARQTIFHDVVRPSHIILPVIPTTS